MVSANAAYFARLGDMDVQFAVPMRALTSFHIGGPADVAFPRTEEELRLALQVAQDMGVCPLIIGNGSNLLVADVGVSAPVICLRDPFCAITAQGERFAAQSGALLTVLAKKSVQAGYQGLEWASGIPGTVGGAVAMNAGAYEHEIREVLTEVTYIENGALYTCAPREGDMGYRSSVFGAPKRVVVSAAFSLQQDDGQAAERMRTYTARRTSKQPLQYPSAGSVFKRPPGQYAGALIEAAGLKGTRIGGAEVSTLHAGFIINVGDATCADVCALIKLIQARVYAQSGVMLERELKIVGGEQACIS